MGLIFHSTNHATKKVDFKTALLQGLALDKGLYTPDSLPRFTEEDLYKLVDLDYSALGFEVLSKLIGDQLPPDVLLKITEDAYNFPVPLENVVGNINVLRLDKGPTASFKDFAARTMSRLMSYFIKQQYRELRNIHYILNHIRFYIAFPHF